MKVSKQEALLKAKKDLIDDDFLKKGGLSKSLIFDNEKCYLAVRRTKTQKRQKQNSYMLGQCDFTKQFISMTEEVGIFQLTLNNKRTKINAVERIAVVSENCKKKNLLFLIRRVVEEKQKNVKTMVDILSARNQNPKKDLQY